MIWFKRIFLFIIVNLLVMTTISLVLNLLGVGAYTTAQGLDLSALAVFCLLWGMVGALISLGLSRIMAKMLYGVKVINPTQANGAERELLELVYRLARQAQLPAMPEVGVYNSPELNAFATGPSKRRALVAISSGLVGSMQRAEVEGVLAHEITHVANGDMVTMTLIQGIVNAFSMFLARVIAFVVTQNMKESQRYVVRMLITFALDIILTLFGSMVVAYFSRLREYRADAGGAKLAGRANMVNALKRLQSRYEPAAATGASQFDTLKISARPGRFLGLLASHPPLEERIARLQTMNVGV